MDTMGHNYETGGDEERQTWELIFDYLGFLVLCDYSRFLEWFRNIRLLTVYDYSRFEYYLGILVFIHIGYWLFTRIISKYPLGITTNILK